jgi:hypothetical protein
MLDDQVVLVGNAVYGDPSELEGVDVHVTSPRSRYARAPWPSRLSGPPVAAK